MVNRSEIELLGTDWPGTLRRVDSLSLSESVSPDDDLTIYVWELGGTSRVVPLLEMFGNRTVKLTGRYSFRYDPPRTASTGANSAPRGDFHLYKGDVEVAAWDNDGKARHGFPAGHRLPRKAYDAIVSQYPGVHGLKGRLLEFCQRAVANGEQTFLIDMNEGEADAADPSKD